MKTTHDQPIPPSDFAPLLEDLSAGCDAEFDSLSDDLERELAELRLALAV